ncbi:MAG: FUSC family protein [Solirubrobacteraceae bacterium]
MNALASINARLRASDPGMFVLKGALRAAIVVPLAFVLSLVVIDSKQMALFAAFGSMALLVFADFGGSRGARLRAYLLLVAAGAVLIVLGTLCSRSPWLATIAMGVVAFIILFAGVLDDYVVAARAAVTLTFVLPVMVPADAAEIPTRLAGWALAGALCIPAALLLWPARPRSVLRREVARAARSLAELVEATSQGDRPAADAAAQSTHAATVAVRGRFVSMTQRPSGTTGPTAALARLIEDLGWVLRIGERPSALASTAAPCPAERYEIELTTATALRGIAARLEGNGPDLPLELARLREAHDVFGRAQLGHFEQMQPNRDEAEAEIELDEAYRLRALSFGVLQAGQDALQACEDHAKATPAQAKATPGQTLRTRIYTARRLMRAHTSTRSVWLRNSLRWAVGLALAVLVGQLADLQNSFWIVLGTMSVLRSNALSTSATIASALLGTLAGIVIGGLIVVAVGGDRGVLWAVLPFAVLLAAYAPQAISFAAGQGAFTIVVLVLFNLIQPAGWRVGLVRVEDVAVGASVSLLVGLLLWPRGATTILRGAIGAAYNGAAHYLDATITALLDGDEQAHSTLAAREAFDTEQLLDAAIRDYLANRGSARGRINDITLLATGASRVRRIARLLQDAHSFMRLAPIDDTLPRLASARDALDAERQARCGWYESFGKAIAQAASSPDAESSDAGTTARAPARELSVAGTTARAPASEVVLEHVDGGDSLQPGLAIAWARRHLHVLAELELMLGSAYGRISL